jgi:CheY-like chemotaxis protein
MGKFPRLHGAGDRREFRNLKFALCIASEIESPLRQRVIMTTRETILVVDDDVDIRCSIAEALEDEGYVAPTAGDGAEALRSLADGRLRPSLILLDLKMPLMDGWAFRVEQTGNPELAHIPVIVFTASKLEAKGAAKLNAAGYLRKPVALDELLDMVADILRRP